MRLHELAKHGLNPTYSSRYTSSSFIEQSDSREIPLTRLHVRVYLYATNRREYCNLGGVL